MLFGVPPGVHLILICAKNLQPSGEYQVVQLPKLDNHNICPVTALKAMIAKFDYIKDTPLFLVENKVVVFFLFQINFITIHFNHHTVKKLNILTYRVAYSDFLSSLSTQKLTCKNKQN